MSRYLPRFAVLLAGFAFLVHTPASAVAADDLEPQTPADLVRGLRQAGLSDFALQFLDESVKAATPDELQTLTLERARLRVELANGEGDEGKREEMTAQAQAEFDKFLKETQPSHPRRAEAAVAYAQLLSIQGKILFNRLGRVPEANRKAEAVKVQALFRDASGKFAVAADLLEKQVQTSTGNRKKELARELLQAKLDGAINQYQLGIAALTDRKLRGDAISEALKGKAAKKGEPGLTGFDALGREDSTEPVCWIARAWVGECYIELDDKGQAQAAFASIAADYRKKPTAAAAAGLRMARYFEIREKFPATGAADNKKLADLCEAWLNDPLFRTPRPTVETYAVIYYRGRSLSDQATAIYAKAIEDAEKAKKPKPPVPPEAVAIYRNAEAVLKKLLETENDYTERATRERNNALRMVVGDAAKPAAQYSTFEECHMAALVQYMRMSEAKTEQERTALLKPTLELLERERELPAPRESAREAQLGTLMLISAYRISGRSTQAAVLAEHAMRSASGPAAVAKVGRQALASYLEAAAKVAPEDAAGRRADTDRALAVATYLEEKAPADPITDEARIVIANQYSQDGKPLEAFKAYTRVSNKAARYALARLLEGGIAYTLIRPLPAGSAEEKKRPQLTTEQKAELYVKATADLAAVPKPAVSAASADVANYARVQMQLAQLHIASGSGGCDPAEKLLIDLRAALPTFTELKEEDRAPLLMQAEIIRLDALFELARVLMKADKFKEAADRLAPVLAEIVNAGPAVKEGLPPALSQLAARLDTSRLSNAVVPALNARVRDGDIAKAGELLDVLKKLGGDVRRSIGAVYEVVETTRPQIDALAKANQPDAANKLRASVSQLVNKLADEKNLAPGDYYNLGRAFNQLGDYPKAIEFLAKVPVPSDPDYVKGDKPQPTKEEFPVDADFKAKFDEWQKGAFEVTRYRLATIERVRALRLSGDLKKCEELLDEVMGKEVPDPKFKGPKGAAVPTVRLGWVAKRGEFRRELATLYEARAAATADAKASDPLWNKAVGEWLTMNTEFRNFLTQPEPKDMQKAGELRQQKEGIRKLFFETYFEQARCKAAAFQHLYKADAKKLEQTMGGVGRSVAAFEKANAAELTAPIHQSFHDLLEKQPLLKKAYIDAGGKLFATKPAADDK